MSDAPESLVFDLVEWVAKEPRTYAAMLDAWRTSCPRLTVWEDAIERNLVMRKPVAGQGTMVVVTAAGRRLLNQRAPAMPVETAAQRRASQPSGRRPSPPTTASITPIGASAAT